MHLLDKHRIDVEKIQTAFLSHRKTEGKCSLKKASRPSNVTRSADYKKLSQATSIDINPLNRILQIDPIERTVLAEPRVTMEELLKATLPYGMMVPVLPEFKGITVGGAIMGAGLESASHRFGLFSDQALSYEILLGDGSIICASPDEHSDLFYGLAGSYGSLGVLLSVTLKLIPTCPFVQLTYHVFHNIIEAIQSISALAHPDFIEGFIFAKNHVVCVEGRFMPLEYGDNYPAFSQKHYWSPWFYQHVKAKQENDTPEKMPLFDYLFRHDRGAFWMGSYGTQWSALPRYFFESRWHLTRCARCLPQSPRIRSPREPSFFYRVLLGWAMSSRRLYTWLHTAHSEEWIANRCMIQDFCIPLHHAASFIEEVLEQTGILPLWLCPISSVDTVQILSPHYNPTSKKLLNVGIYGIPIQQQKGTAQLLASLEETAQRMKGRKMLYSYSQYTPEQFWDIYPKERYERLRKTYYADTWTPIDAKVLGRYLR